MKIKFEVLKCVTLSKKKPWQSIKCVTEDKDELLLLSRKNASLFNLASGRVQKKLSKVKNCLKNSSVTANTKDGNHLIILSQTGSIFITKSNSDHTWTIPDIPFQFSPAKNLKQFIFVSDIVETILVILHTRQIYLWQRDDELDVKSSTLRGNWTQIDLSPEIPFQLTNNTTADVVFVDNSTWGKCIICSLIFVCENEIAFTTLQIWNLNRRIKVSWLNSLTNFKSLNSNVVPFVDKRAFVVRFANNEPLLAVGVNQKQAGNSYLIFTIPLLENNNKYINLPSGEDDGRFQYITDISWLSNNTLLLCLHNNGTFCIMSRLGHPIQIGLQGCNFNLPFSFYLSLNSINRDAINSKLEEDSESITDSNISKQRFAIAAHAMSPVMYYYDGFSIFYLLIPPIIQNEVMLIENLLTANSHIPARVIYPKDKTKFKLVHMNSENSSTQSENTQEKEFASLRRISHVSNVTTAIGDLLASFGLMASTRIPWDEKMEVMSVDAVGKLAKVLEDLFVYSVDVDGNWKFPVGIIDSVLLKCFNMLRFDIHHNLIPTALKFLITVIDILINNVKRIKSKQRTQYLKCIQEIMVNSEHLLNDVYGWALQNNQNIPFSYKSTQLIKSAKSAEFNSCFQYRLKMKWKELYKVIAQQFIQNQNKQVGNDDQKCRDLLCEVQLKLQLTGYAFKRHKKTRLSKGVYSFLNGNYNSAILTWTLQMDELLSSENFHKKSAKRLEKILHSILYGLLITYNFITVFKLVQKLLKFLQFDSSFTRTSSINSIFLTLAHLMASYLTNSSFEVPKWSTLMHKSIENSDLFQILLRDDIQFAITTNGLSDFWSAETVCALYVYVGAFAEAVTFAHSVGDWKTAFLMSVVHNNISVTELPIGLNKEDLMIAAIKKIVQTKDKAVMDVLQDHMTASVLCDVNVVIILLDHCINEVKLLLQHLPFAVPKEFYLPAPPIFCPQDEMVFSTSAAKTETEFRNKLSTLIDTLINLFSASKTLLPIAQIYANSLHYSPLIHPFTEYQSQLITDELQHSETLHRMQLAFQDICSIIWLLHLRDKLGIEWRKFWHFASVVKPSQQKCNALCLSALTWIKCIKPFTNLMQCNLEFYQTVLTLIREVTPSTKIVDVFSELVPDKTKLPLECESKLKLLLKEWEITKIDKNSSQTLHDYYINLCNHMTKNVKPKLESQLGIESNIHETNDDFLKLMCLFHDVAIHKQAEERINQKHDIPLLVSHAEKLKEAEFSRNKYSLASHQVNEHCLPQSDDIKLNITVSNKRKNFFQSLSLLDLSQSHLKMTPKRSRSLENFKHKDKAVTNFRKKLPSNTVPIRSIINELQSISMQREVERNEKMSDLNHLILWLDKWKGRNHNVRMLECNSEIKQQFQIKTPVEQILSSVSRLEIYKTKVPKQQKRILAQAKKTAFNNTLNNKIFSVEYNRNSSHSSKMNKQNAVISEPEVPNNYFAPECVSQSAQNSEKLEEHIHPTGPDLPRQSQTVSEKSFVKHLPSSNHKKPTTNSIDQIHESIPKNEYVEPSSDHSPSYSNEEDDDTLNDVSFPNSIPEPPPRTVRFDIPRTPPLPKPCIPKFLRLIAEKENFQSTDSTDPRLRGGGCFGQMQLPLLRASAPQNFNVASPPCFSHMGLPLLRLPQKYLNTQTQQQQSPQCHVCVDDSTCNQNLYIQNMLRSYWINVKQNRCQQMVDYSQNRNIVHHEAIPTECQIPYSRPMRLLKAKHSSSEDNVYSKYRICSTSNVPHVIQSEESVESNGYLCDRYQQYQSDSSCQHEAGVLNFPPRMERIHPHTKVMSRATSPIRTPSPVRTVTRTTSPQKMLSKTTSPIKTWSHTALSKMTSPIKTNWSHRRLSKTTSPIKTNSNFSMKERETKPILMSTPPRSLSPRGCSPSPQVSQNGYSPPAPISLERCSPPPSISQNKYSPLTPISPRTYSPQYSAETASLSPPRSPQLSPRRTYSPPLFPKGICSTVQSQKRMFGPSQSPIRISSPLHSPKRISSPLHSPKRLSSPLYSPKRLSSPLQSPKRICSPPSPPRKASSPPARISSVIKSKSLSANKIYTRSPSPIRCIKSPSPTRRKHIIHSCTSSLHYPSNENVELSPRRHSNGNSQTPIKEDVDYSSYLDWQPHISKSQERKPCKTKTIETQVDIVQSSPAIPEYNLISDDIKHGLLDVVNEFAETHHQVINQLEEVHELMKEMQKQDKERTIQIEHNLPVSDTNQNVISQIQEVHDFMRKMSHQKNKEENTVRKCELSNSNHSGRELEAPADKFHCLDITKTNFEKTLRRQLPEIPPPPIPVPSHHSSCSAALYGKKFTAQKSQCHPVHKQKIPGLEGCDGTNKSPSNERKCKMREKAKPPSNAFPFTNCIQNDPPNPYLYGRILNNSPKRVTQIDSNRRKLEACPSPLSIKAPGPMTSKYYNYIGQKTSKNCLAQRPWALKSTANPRSLKIQTTNTPIQAQTMKKCLPVTENYYPPTKTLSPTHYGRTSMSPKEREQTRPLITSPYLANLHCVAPALSSELNPLAECVKRQKMLSLKPENSKINPFVIERISESPLEDEKENIGQIVDKNWHSTSVLYHPNGAESRGHRNLRSWSNNIAKTNERETSGADEGHISPRGVAIRDKDNLQKNFNLEIDTENAKNSILDFQIPDLPHKTNERETPIIVEAPIPNQEHTLVIEDLEIEEELRTPQVKARDCLQRKLQNMKEQCDLMENISNELQLEFEHSKQLLNSVSKLSENTMFQPNPALLFHEKTHPIYKSPRFTLDLSPKAKLIVHFSKSGQQTSPITTCLSKSLSPHTETLSICTDRIPSATTSKNVPSVQSPIHSQKEFQHSMHFKMRMQDACELMKDLLSSDTNLPSSSTDHLAPSESTKPKEMKQILTKMEENLKKDLSKMGIHKASYLPATSWTTNSNDSVLMNAKDEVRSTDTATTEVNILHEKSRSKLSLSNGDHDLGNGRIGVGKKKVLAKTMVAESAIDEARSMDTAIAEIDLRERGRSKSSLSIGDQDLDDGRVRFGKKIGLAKPRVVESRIAEVSERTSVRPSEYRGVGDRRKIKLSDSKFAQTLDKRYIKPLAERKRVKWKHKPRDIRIRMTRTEQLRKKLAEQKKAETVKTGNPLSTQRVLTSKVDLKQQKEDDDPPDDSENSLSPQTSSPNSWNVPLDVMKIIYDEKDAVEDYYND